MKTNSPGRKKAIEIIVRRLLVTYLFFHLAPTSFCAHAGEKHITADTRSVVEKYTFGFKRDITVPVMVIGDDDLVLVTGDSYPYNPHSLVSPSVRVPDQIQAEVKWVHDNSDAKDDNFDDDAGDGDDDDNDVDDDDDDDNHDDKNPKIIPFPTKRV